MTIKQLAAELGVSREAVRLQVLKLSASDVEKGKNRTTIITDAGADIIREWFKDAPNSNNNTTSSNFDKSDDISQNQTMVCESCEMLQQQVTNLQQQATSIGNDLEAKIQQIQLLSDNITDLRAIVERQATELQAKDRQIAEQAAERKAEAERNAKQITDLMQMLQAEQLMRGRVLQLDKPKKKPKLFSIFSRKKDNEAQ